MKNGTGDVAMKSRVSRKWLFSLVALLVCLLVPTPTRAATITIDDGVVVGPLGEMITITLSGFVDLAGIVLPDVTISVPESPLGVPFSGFFVPSVGTPIGGVGTVNLLEPGPRSELSDTLSVNFNVAPGPPAGALLGFVNGTFISDPFLLPIFGAVGIVEDGAFHDVTSVLGLIPVGGLTILVRSDVDPAGPAVPEPTTVGLLATGLLLTVMRARRRREP